MHRRRREALAGYVFMIPWLAGFFLLTLLPMVVSGYLSFTNYDMFTTPTFIGLKNYQTMLTDKKFIGSIAVTFKYVLVGVPLQIVFALLLSVVFKRTRVGIRFYRAAYYLPSLFGASIAVAILWRQIFNKTGLFNSVLTLLGTPSTKNWINSPDTALNTLIVLLVWQFGATMVVFLASLKQIPDELYEAATIDGANKVRQFFKITLPLLTPMVFFNIVMSFIAAFQSFTPAYIVSGGTGGPLNSTMFYSLYLYIQGFTYFKMGYASALGWVLLIIIAVFTGLLFLSSKKWVYENN